LAAFTIPAFSTTPGNFTFTVPSGVTNILVEAWGGGGGAGGSVSENIFTGGGGGAYVRAVVPVTPEEVFTIQVGFGGASHPNSAGSGGGDTTFSGGSIFITAGAGTAGSSSATGTGGSPSGAPANSLAVPGSGGGATGQAGSSFSGFFGQGGYLTIVDIPGESVSATGAGNGAVIIQW
jgi:hypothetical protein